MKWKRARFLTSSWGRSYMPFLRFGNVFRIIDEFDAKRLYALIKERHIKNVLELGMGIGTATAIMLKAGARVIAVESEPVCISLAQCLIPKALRKNVRIIQAKVLIKAEVLELDGRVAMRYNSYDAILPFEDVDLIVVDGPDSEGEYICGDALFNSDRIKRNACIYVDGRKPSVKAYRKRFKIIEESKGHALFQV